MKLEMEKSTKINSRLLLIANDVDDKRLKSIRLINSITLCIICCTLMCLCGLGAISILAHTEMIDLKIVRWGVMSKNSTQFEKGIRIEYDRNNGAIIKSREEIKECNNIAVNRRFDCHPENGASELSCVARGCCWNAIYQLDDKNNNKRMNEEKVGQALNVPFCFYPLDWTLYEYKRINGTNGTRLFEAEMVNTKKSFYSKDISVLKIEAYQVGEQSKNTLRVKIYDSQHKRYEPMWPIRMDEMKNESNDNLSPSDYEFEIDHSKPGWRIKRKSTGTIIFDSISVGGFIFADQLLQISTLLPSENIYGLGEHRTSLKLNINWQRLTLFNKDQPPTENANLYGSHPFYMVVEKSGHSHGVLFLNSNAMDVIMQPTPAITFRTIGGIFDMYFFMGPEPYDVLHQLSHIIGKPFMPPYWSLGFHLCRLGYGSLEGTQKIFNRTRNAGIPFDTQWNDLDYMDNNNDFTYNKDTFRGLPEFIQQLHDIGMHYIPLVDAGISASESNGTYPPFDEGLRQDIFIKDNKTNMAFIGKVWNRKSTVWPDFTHPKSHDYWYEMLKNMHDQFEYDGLWIDMNEPSNFYNGHVDGCSNNPLDNPPYVPGVVGNLLSTKTICMDAKHAGGTHYDIHNIYAAAQAVASQSALSQIRNKRPFIVSRATWIGQGQYSAHWTGDIYSSWHDLRMSIPEILQFSLFQIPMVGADICGFDGNTTIELCSRWMQVGAFYPFSRNHNSDDTIEQDPVALGNLVVESSKKAFMIKYRLLPYLYTLFFNAHTTGTPVINPLFFIFWQDKNTLSIDSQFLWGESLMIVPVLEKGKTNVKCYLPKGVWYDYYNSTGIVSEGNWFSLDAPLDTIPLLIREGAILPGQSPGQTTTESRKNHFELIITIYQELNRTPTGSLYWDDGDSVMSVALQSSLLVNFQVNDGRKLINSWSHLGAPTLKESLILDKIEIMGVNNIVENVTVNGKFINSYVYYKSRNYLVITDLAIDMTKLFQVTW